MIAHKRNGIRRVPECPTGYRELGKKPIRRTELAILFDYHGHEIWAPKKSLRKIVKGAYCCPSWVVENPIDPDTYGMAEERRRHP